MIKFYSYANKNKDYVKAINLRGIRSIQKTAETGKSQIRFGVMINYLNGNREHFSHLEDEEATKVYTEILILLNGGEK